MISFLSVSKRCMVQRIQTSVVHFHTLVASFPVTGGEIKVQKNRCFVSTALLYRGLMLPSDSKIIS